MKKEIAGTIDRLLAGEANSPCDRFLGFRTSSPGRLSMLSVMVFAFLCGMAALYVAAFLPN